MTIHKTTVAETLGQRLSKLKIVWQRILRLSNGCPAPQPRWSREQIRAARRAPLLPLLQQRGLQLLEPGAGNFRLPAFPGLIVKDSYWRWPQRDRAGNTIDFFVQVLGLSFHQAMQQIIVARP